MSLLGVGGGEGEGNSWVQNRLVHGPGEGGGGGNPWRPRVPEDTGEVVPVGAGLALQREGRRVAGEEPPRFPRSLVQGSVGAGLF